ncbi:cysteinyl-tRNA synthetase [Denitrovibrio acetiphilus DSM 12809]|uniref:Cysteine--tRNA ligase n=1 Tax=Denitrovibrio acetiphilus (strain DSM 12809 / NBRC 114555 / N2460) TaxID=522772 RepID=D4H0N2_DENA2|nr:cysteine--tRNA ligase [Denitrovibrio acetiphilus]ADD68545.1 cysteinyl-tRNA synthetase [Denitrovibrio acetiphilus DSM 12809]
MLKVFNTLSNKKEEFQPLQKDNVKIYVCGVTVYDLCHIGHARSSGVFDVIRRYLMFKGYNVTFVKNFTDIDDKIIKRSNEKQMDWRELAANFIAEHDADMDSLNILRPDHTPKATDYIKQMIQMCETLIEKGFAYESNGDIYYRVQKFEEYGKLSHRKLEDMMAGARIEVSVKKENPYDFVLWKASKPGEPSWESPWGQGRPGWHIECSVMSEDLLGLPFDIHGGGKDLVFPHHENEIAQSEAACGCMFSKYWIHNGFVNVNQEKMSKSLGNFFTIRDVLKEFDAEIVRYFLMTTHYRSALDFSQDHLLEAEKSLNRIYTMLDEISRFNAGKKGVDITKEAEKMKETFMDKFQTAMDDDFNTPEALAAMFEVIRETNRLLGSKPNKISFPALQEAVQDVFKVILDVLGIVKYTPEKWFRINLSISEEELRQKIQDRADAKKDKNFELADSIRQELKQQGIELLDTIDGTIYRAVKIRNL